MGRGIGIFSSLAVAAVLLAGCATIRQWMSDKQMSPAEKVMQSVPAAAKPKPVENRPVRYSEEKAVIKENWSPEESTERLEKQFLDRLFDVARSKIGCRYMYASKGPNTFDCSGFTSYVFGRFGINLSPSSSLQALQGRRLDKDEPLRPGDLVFFSGRKISKTVGHVGIVIGQDSQTGEFTFIHAAVSAGVEIQKSTQEYYAPRYLYASRVLPDVEIIQEDCGGRDLRRTFYILAAGIADGVGYDLLDTDSDEVKTALFDNATWASVRSTEHPVSGATLDAMAIEYQKLYKEFFPNRTSVAETPRNSPQAESSQPSDEFYSVRSGDTLSRIASRYHTTVGKLCSLNGITERTILKIGQKLRLK